MWASGVAAVACLLLVLPTGRGIAADEAASAAGSAPPAGKTREEPGQVKHLAPAEAATVLGRPVRGPDGHEFGRIVDILVDQAGHPRAAVIDFGGFMGVGSRKIAVDWHLLHFTPGDLDKPITLDLSPDQIKAAPEYKSGSTNPTIVAAPPPAPPAAPAGTPNAAVQPPDAAAAAPAPGAAQTGAPAGNQ
jgi:PRC-barrel domain protein